MIATMTARIGNNGYTWHDITNGAINFACTFNVIVNRIAGSFCDLFSFIYSNHRRILPVSFRKRYRHAAFYK